MITNVAAGKKITIIGGKGLMGQLFIRYWQEAGVETQTLSRDGWENVDRLLQGADLVIVCVPINSTYEIIKKAGHYLSPTTILADFTSIKEPVIECMQTVHSGPILGLHPMFGPTINSPQSQVIINCGGTQTEKSAWVIESLKQLGFSLHSMSAAEHDLAMSFIQGIEHFSTFTLGSFLKTQNVHPQTLFSLASPIYQAKLALLGRIFDQSAELYADIIMADSQRLELIEKYLQHMQAWVAKLKADKREEFVNEFNQTASWMGDFTHKSQAASDQFLDEVIESTHLHWR